VCIAAELVHHGFAVHGRRRGELFTPMTDDQVRTAARAELCGYWAWASRRPWMWLNPVIADLGLTSMARGRSTLQSGRLLTKSEAIEKARAPEWLIDQLRARRRGEPVVSHDCPSAGSHGGTPAEQSAQPADQPFDSGTPLVD
jgi:hypothetical protein